ncbi:hypothetical protein OZX68_03405 [Streptococcaceae bacterium ESL0729]|nr:hypothetical protein OZX68_03405 [Streptococcaceae bacterium ESL0729]
MISNENFDLNDLLGGINVIANVLLIGKSVEEIKYANTIDLYVSLAEMTEQYASTLLEKGGELELKQSRQKLKVIDLINEL